LKGWVFDSRPLSELPQRSIGKSVHLNRPGKIQTAGVKTSGFGPETGNYPEPISNLDKKTRIAKYCSKG